MGIATMPVVTLPLQSTSKIIMILVMRTLGIISTLLYIQVGDWVPSTYQMKLRIDPRKAFMGSDLEESVRILWTINVRPKKPSNIMRVRNSKTIQT